MPCRLNLPQRLQAGKLKKPPHYIMPCPFKWTGTFAFLDWLCCIPPLPHENCFCLSFVEPLQNVPE